MALAKDRKPYDSHVGLVQACTYYGNVLGGSSAEVSSQYSPEGDTSEKVSGFVKNLAMSRSPSLYQPEEEEALSVINFKTGYNNVMHDNGSFLSFEKTDDQLPHTSYPRISQQDHDEYSIWEDDTIQSYQHDHQLHPKCSTTSKSGRLFQDFNCVQSTSSYGCGSNTMRENHHGGEPFGWANSEANASTGTIQEFVTLESACFNKRPHQGDRMQDLKRQCTGATRKPKPKTIPSKDPQSIAAKNRRERISERLKVLQELVPNGTKVDLVTMLEKAISYVKFLQLQVKVLATDEFWPVQGGKAPDISQVKEAIDAILSSQKDRNSSSN